MLFAQATPGCEPRDQETNIRSKRFSYRQSAIFADIQDWDLRAAWIDECDCGQAPGWKPEETDLLNHIGCIT
jgi:hypothetical protein